MTAADHAVESSPQETGRRRFLHTLSILAGSIAAAMVVIPSVAFLLGLRKAPMVWRSVGKVASFWIGTTVEVSFMDPTIEDASPRPDWYFMWYFAVLSLIPHWIENYVIFLGPVLFGLVMILLPLVASRGERHPFRRPWSFGVVGCVVFIVAYYWSVGVVAPWSPRLASLPLPAEVVGATSGPIAEGAQVFYRKGCEFCHMVSGCGGDRGPDLTYAGDRMNEAQITTRFFSGATNMPSYTGNMTPEQLTALVAFLESRRRTSTINPYTNPPKGGSPAQR